MDQNETKNSHTEFWSLASIQEGLTDNIKRRTAEYFFSGRFCLFIYHTIAINFPRTSSHSYKLPEKIVAKIFLPKKILHTSTSLEIRGTSPSCQGTWYSSVTNGVMPPERCVIMLNYSELPDNKHEEICQLIICNCYPFSHLQKVACLREQPRETEYCSNREKTLTTHIAYRGGKMTWWSKWSQNNTDMPRQCAKSR